MNFTRRVLSLAFLATSQCAHSATPPPGHVMVRGVPLAANVHCANADCSSFNVKSTILAHTAISVQCMGDTAPGATPNPAPRPISYLVSDIGKPGMPALNMNELSTIDHIRQYVHSKILRFTWVADHKTIHKLLIFDALDGPCTIASLGYPVLNGACNEYYKPGENPYGTLAAPGEAGCDHPSPRPWMIGQ